jgi:hypothetical protein
MPVRRLLLPVGSERPGEFLREWMPSFWYTCRRWYSTVFGLRNSAAAVSLVVLPPARASAICSSCGVSSSIVAGSRRLRVSPVAASSALARSAHGPAPRCSKMSSAARSCSRASTRFLARRRALAVGQPGPRRLEGIRGLPTRSHRPRPFPSTAGDRSRRRIVPPAVVPTAAEPLPSVKYTKPCSIFAELRFCASWGARRPINVRQQAACAGGLRAHVPGSAEVTARRAHGCNPRDRHGGFGDAAVWRAQVFAH